MDTAKVENRIEEASAKKLVGEHNIFTTVDLITSREK
jgi:hypothetical protein